ncbi:PGAP1 family protein [Anaeromyxobacter dehalogenans 2CP-1]|uniref:PGAP1 family protein n=1 Tax=Anaeromyxobacter dehalogenans (strain ATCC BAA-258 / DSM 21875 / 2CP-1) TaxID=455488 RepID=B8JF17_ANAD2|nr:permease [Anaeromyxobacter dehalogenans]ACL64374.1 PGAP1 family protein [Anaeromyxobacter dehalogenans 2CP-1]
MRTRVDVTDLRGWGRLAFDATLGVTAVVEGMHHNIARGPWFLDAPPSARTRGLTGLVYGAVRGVTRIVGEGYDAALSRAAGRTGQASSPRREAVLAALNGVLGDHLVASRNPLAIPMQLRSGGRPVALEPRALREAIPGATGKVVVLVHGLCTNHLRWRRRGHDHGAALARDLGYTPLYLHYNSGLHVSTSGRGLDEVLEALVRAWPMPLEELSLLGHSLGGLVVRSAWHQGAAAGHAWPRRLRSAVFLGTPHHGAALERGGNWIDVVLGVSPYTAPLARLGRIRSAGITDLRHGNVLDEDWQGRDRFARSPDRRRPVPLPPGVRCLAVAGTTARGRGAAADLLGDGLVPLASALGRHRDPRRTLAFGPAGRAIAPGVGHLDLLCDPGVYARVREWLAG